MKTAAVTALFCATALTLSEVEANTLSIPISKKQIPNKSLRDRIRDNTLGVRHRFFEGRPIVGRRGYNATVSDLGDTPLTDYSDELYTAPVTLGNGQSFTLDLDTGSADVWFRGPKCTSSDGSCGTSGQNVVSLSDKSLTSQGFSWSTSYGSGSVSGNVYAGPIQLGTDANSKASSLQFGVSTSETGFDSPGDGLLGLGFSSISQITAAGGTNSNFIDALKLSSNKFSFYLSDSVDTSDKGEVTIGGYNSNYFTGSLQYTPLNAETYWQFDLTSATYSVSGTSGNLVTSVSNGICDTGTTLMILEQAAADAINSAIGAGSYDSSAGYYSIACSIASTGPNVVFTVNNIQLTVTAAQYVMNVGSSQCISGITRGATSSGVQIFGDTFLRAVYTVFDKDNKQLGWAPANHKHKFAQDQNQDDDDGIFILTK